MAATEDRWRARAETARRLSESLAPKDAEMLNDFAEECEMRARCQSSHPPDRRPCVTCPLSPRGSCSS
jgi:hypothetical protein